MKKVISLVLVVLMLAATLCACTQPDAGASSTTTKPNEPADPNAPVVINVNSFVSDTANWEFDDDYNLKTEGGKIVFNTTEAGEFMAGMLKKPAKDVTYKFTITVNELPEGAEELTPEDGAYWDIEMFIIARASVPAGTWPGSGDQTGYCLSSWGGLGKVAIGRCGYDNACGEFEWNIADGQPHEVEFTVKDNADGTVNIILVVDGTEIANVVDNGAPRADKPERPTKYPDAGNLVIRTKYMKVTIG